MPQPSPRPRTSPPARPSRRERRRAETRERIFRAALQLFAKRGFTATTVEDITEAADVGKGTFFNYFPSKEHVLAAFAEMQLGKLQAAAAAAPGARESIRQTLHRLTQSLAEEPGRSPALVRGMLQANLSSDAVREQFLGYLERGRQLLAKVMALGQQRGEIRRDRKPIELARVIQQSFFGAMLMWSLHPLSPLTEWFDITFNLLWSGVAAPTKHGTEKLS